MDDLRLKRYRDKINYVIKSIRYIDDKPENELEKRGIFYSLQTSIESIIDLIAMYVKDSGIPIKDDQQNISEFVKLTNLDPLIEEEIKKANGMRNIIVHRYNNVDDEIILSSIEKVKKLLLVCIDKIEVFLDKITHNWRN